MPSCRAITGRVWTWMPARPKRNRHSQTQDGTAGLAYDLNGRGGQSKALGKLLGAGLVSCLLEEGLFQAYQPPQFAGEMTWQANRVGGVFQGSADVLPDPPGGIGT